MAKTPIPIDPAAHLIYEALTQLKWSINPKTFLQRIKRLDLGLPAEDEFSMIVSWLGRCKLIHKLDQQQTPPTLKEHYRIPDLLAFFDYDGKRIPVLIEVKTTTKPRLSWKANYIKGIRQYAREIGLPMLVAWKWRPLNVWMLFELTHFVRRSQNYKVKFETAMTHNLMGLLAGDFMFKLKSSVGIHFACRKEQKLRVRKKNGAVEEDWIFRIEDAYFTNSSGSHLEKLGPGVWALLLSAGLHSHSEITDTHLYQSFVIPDDEPMQWAQRGLSLLLELGTKENHPIKWREILLNHRIPVESSKLKEAAKDGLSLGITRYVFSSYLPKRRPRFLSSRSDKGGTK